MKTLKQIGISLLALVMLCAVIGALVTPRNDVQGDSPAPPDATPSPEWQDLVSLSGNGDRESAIFAISSAETRLRYEVTGEPNLTVFGVYVVEEGGRLASDGGLPEIMLRGPDSGESYLHLDAGRYYLQITGTNCDWSVAVEERR